MSRIISEQLQAGVIFGDAAEREYIYMPGGEIGLTAPLCRVETSAGEQDMPLAEAAELVLKWSLKPAVHPRWGKKSF